MAQIHILRTHALGLDAAMELAHDWQDQAETSWGLCCVTQADADLYQVNFERPGLQGSFRVTADTFELRMTLGFLLSAYRGRIESELQRRLDKLLSAG